MPSKEIFDPEYPQIKETLTGTHEQIADKEKIINLYREAKLTGDKNRLVEAHMTKVLFDLKYQYGVADLTTIELVRLRKVVEELLKQSIEEEKSEQEGSGTEGHIPNEPKEALSRWLFELYGIKSYDVPYEFILEERKTGKEIAHYQEMEKERAWADKKQINARKGKKVSLSTERIPADFKEYLRRLRAKAHTPEL